MSDTPSTPPGPQDPQRTSGEADAPRERPAYAHAPPVFQVAKSETENQLLTATSSHPLLEGVDWTWTGERNGEVTADITVGERFVPAYIIPVEPGTPFTARGLKELLDDHFTSPRRLAEVQQSVLDTQAVVAAIASGEKVVPRLASAPPDSPAVRLAESRGIRAPVPLVAPQRPTPSNRARNEPRIHKGRTLRAGRDINSSRPSPSQEPYNGPEMS